MQDIFGGNILFLLTLKGMEISLSWRGNIETKLCQQQVHIKIQRSYSDACFEGAT